MAACFHVLVYSFMIRTVMAALLDIQVDFFVISAVIFAAFHVLMNSLVIGTVMAAFLDFRMNFFVISTIILAVFYALMDGVVHATIVLTTGWILMVRMVVRTVSSAASLVMTIVSMMPMSENRYVKSTGTKDSRYYS
ncbi:hypothetical protein C806_01316 [Lachnospiraceae bacterium 3-1]|nr:hypothetical protein C806_01316 [Lachnospiraceae bacterium 3-1]